MTNPKKYGLSDSPNRGKFYFPAALAVLTLATRLLFRGPVYFADGPAHIESVIKRVFIIQPPGYWLFNRIAGLFHDPVIAISTMNILFSVAGVVVFYYTACFFTGRTNAFLAALAYSAVFYIWFSGEVHSTYASQILFPVATFCVLLCYERDGAKWELWLGAILFALGAGLRPSDGVFLTPMVLYFAIFKMRRKESLIFLSIIFIACLGWVIPTLLAYRGYHEYPNGAVGYVRYIVGVKSILTGVNAYTVGNLIRYTVPLVAAFWPVLGVAAVGAVKNWADWRVKAMVIWIVPGSLFFVLSLIADAPYLNFLSAAILLLAVTAPRMMVVTAVWNALLFVAINPFPSQNLAVNIVNCYVLRYTHYGIQNQWQMNLSEIQKANN